MAKILIVAPNWLGDLIMAQSLFIVLKQQQHTLEVLAPKWCVSVCERMPEVDNIVVLPFTHGEWRLRDRYRFAQQLRTANYDQAIILPNSWKSALLPWLAGIPRRIGWRGEWRYGLLTEVRILDPVALPRMVDRFVALATTPNTTCATHYPQLTTQHANQELLRQQYNMHATAPIAVLAPGAEFGSAKRWPALYYTDLAQQLLKQDWQVVLLGSAKEQTLLHAINNACEYQCLDLAGKLALADVVDVLGIAKVVISNDSGLMHMAAAVATPTVAIYGSTSPAFTPPLSKKVVIVQQELACRPCFQRECPLEHLQCLTSISPKQVLTAIKQVLQL